MANKNVKLVFSTNLQKTRKHKIHSKLSREKAMHINPNHSFKFPMSVFHRFPVFLAMTKTQKQTCSFKVFQSKTIQTKSKRKKNFNIFYKYQKVFYFTTVFFFILDKLRYVSLVFTCSNFECVVEQWWIVKLQPAMK